MCFQYEADEIAFEKQKQGHMRDLEDGGYFEEFLEDFPHMADGALVTLFQIWLENTDEAKVIQAQSLIRMFYENWKEAKACELAE